MINARSNRWSSVWTLLLAGLVVLPACEAPEPEPEDETAVDRSGASQARAAERTLAEPPELEVGEWWTFEARGEEADADYQVTVVVAEREDDMARLGLSAEDFDDDLFVFHIPPLGDVDPETLAWRVMWEDFEALRFPLEEGRTWEADFHGFDVEAEVAEVDGSRAHVHMEGDDPAWGEQRIELVYDARRGMITELHEENIGLSFRVIDHGFGHEEPVKTPRGIEMSLLDFRPGELMELVGEEVPEDEGRSSIEVEVDHSHGSMGLVMQHEPAPEESGTYEIAATNPEGETFEAVFEFEPGDPLLALEAFPTDAVQGTWEIEYHRDGAGILAAEFFTYDLVESRPGGRP